MKIAVLSDVHSNRQALDAVIADLPQVDEVLCLGDVVGYGGDPQACLDTVRAAGWLTLAGNHDRACTDPSLLDWFNDDAGRVLKWTITQLPSEDLRWLSDLPEQSEREGALLVHGSPRSPTFEYILDGSSAMANLRLLGSSVCFHGHSHIPGMFHVEQNGRLGHDYAERTFDVQGPALVNPGSVGQPRDGDPDASYLVWDSKQATVEFRRVAYDREGAKRAVLEARLPPRFASRLDVGR
jgi:diadenosine tetraphosphatase ApaH/serine/threonine PP2A family protein phosphatase